MKSKHAFALWAILAAGLVNKTLACACAGEALNDRDSAIEQFHEATVVFEGEVVSEQQIAAVDPNGPGLAVISFTVLRAYKGTLGHTVQMYDPMAGTDCGFGGSKAGDKFFIYGFSGKDEKMYVEACTRTSPLE